MKFFTTEAEIWDCGEIPNCKACGWYENPFTAQKMCLECHQGWYKTDGNMVCTPDGTSPGGGSSGGGGGDLIPELIECPTEINNCAMCY